MGKWVAGVLSTILSGVAVWWLTQGITKFWEKAPAPLTPPSVISSPNPSGNSEKHVPPEAIFEFK
jgi:hypothetical protein